jgi:hypothetical protein
MSQELVNDYLVLLMGESASGKSASLRDLKSPEGVMYLNTEAGKRLPFRSKFQSYKVTDPLQIIEGIQEAENMPEIHTIVIDSMTFMLDMFKSLYVRNSTNGMKAWDDFAEFFKDLMQQKVAASTKNVLFTAHTLDTYNETKMCMETKIAVPGSLKNNGLESYFSLCIATKKMKVTDLSKYKSALLTITPQEEALGIKYVYQTQLTKSTVNERIRGPMGMFDENETFIDNNMQLVFDRLHEYYAA